MIAFAAMSSTAIAQEINQGAAIEFEKDINDYGEIAHQSNGTYSFKFSNTGSEPLMITNAKGSCGCTVPSWPKTPIAPGESASIDVTYDTKRVGPFNKSVTITSNAVNTPVKVIRIEGTVLAAGVEAETVEEVEEVVDAVVEDPLVEPVEMTAKQLKAQAKAEKKRLKKAAKAKKKAAKLALKAEKKALKAERKKAAAEAKA